MTARFTPAASRDVLRARRWYDSQESGLGGEFAQVIDACIERLLQFPLSAPVAYRQTRRAVVDKFPFVVYYLAQQGTILIICCLHTRRDLPAVLRRRLP